MHGSTHPPSPNPPSCKQSLLRNYGLMWQSLLCRKLPQLFDAPCFFRRPASSGSGMAKRNCVWEKSECASSGTKTCLILDSRLIKDCSKNCLIDDSSKYVWYETAQKGFLLKTTILYKRVESCKDRETEKGWTFGAPQNDFWAQVFVSIRLFFEQNSDTVSPLYFKAKSWDS